MLKISNKWTQLRFAAALSLLVHVIAGLAMATVLCHGLETNSDVTSRFTFLTEHNLLWVSAWCTWNAAALSLFYFYWSFIKTHKESADKATKAIFTVVILLTIAGVIFDLSAESMEMFILPSVAKDALVANSLSQIFSERFFSVHRNAVLLTGFMANSLYTLGAILLSWSTRDRYPVWVWGAGLCVGISGMSLSLAVLENSVRGMFWSNVVLVPAIVVWQLGVAIQSK